MKCLRRLSRCMVTKEGCSYLAFALSLNPFHLRELDLSYNDLGDSGVKIFSALLEDPNCKLEILRCVRIMCLDMSFMTANFKVEAAVHNFVWLKIIRNQYLNKYISSQCSNLLHYFSSTHNG